MASHIPCIGQEILHTLVQAGKHELLVLSRHDAPAQDLGTGVTWAKVDYNNVAHLAETLRGVDTVLSFIVVHADPGNVAQRNLIDAAVEAGVRRFAPSEWGAPSVEHMPWYTGKVEIREYLASLNKDKKILEYSLFYAGFLLNYLTHPHQSARHVPSIPTPFDFAHCRALVVEGREDVLITLTEAGDVARLVARAVDWEGEWPVVGGVRGETVAIGEIIAIGERIRGPFTVEKLNPTDLASGTVKSTWMPRAEHPSIPAAQADAMAEALTAGIVLGFSTGGWAVSDEWNRLVPGCGFVGVEEWLKRWWN